MKRQLAAVVIAAFASVAAAQESAGETYFDVLGNFLLSPDSTRKLDGFGLQVLYGTRNSFLGLPLEYRAFYDRLEPENSRSSVEFFRAGVGADVVLGLSELGVPELPFVRPFLLGGAGVVHGDAVPRGESKTDVFANVGVGAMSAPLSEQGWRVRGDLKYVYENLGDGYSDLHLALGLHIPLGEVMAAPAAEPESVQMVEAETPDSDGDGVADNADRCPGTPAGAAVNGEGCVEQSVPTAVLAMEGVTFDSNSDQLREGSSTILDEAAATLNSKYPAARVEAAGHTDDSGDSAYNLDLSRRRAATVRQYLITQGVDENRLTAEGYGEAQPTADNSSAEGRAKNRRVELRVRE